MAQIAGTLDTYAARRQAEDVRDILYTIAVKDKPFMKLVGEGAMPKAKKHEWQNDTLRAPNNNAKIEADQFSFSAPAQPTDVINYCQISTETLNISGTTEAIKMYGRGSSRGGEMKRQLKKKALELGRDIEFANVATSRASVAGSSVLARQSASFNSFITTNVNRGATGANGGFQIGTGLVNAPTDGTLRPFTEVIHKDIMQKSFTTGNAPRFVMMSPKDKVVFSTFPGIATNRINYTPEDAKTREAVIMGAADVYQSDFGMVTAIPNPYMSTAQGGRQRDALYIDPNYVELCYLRKMQKENLAKTADSEQAALVCEWTLVVTNEAAHGVAADLA